MLAQEKIEESKRKYSDQGVHDACAGFVDAEYGYARSAEDIHKRRQYVAQLFIECPPIGAAHQIPSIPAGNVSLFKEVLADQGCGRLVVPQRGVV